MLSTQMEVFAKTKDWDHGLVSNVYSVDMDTVTVHENQDPSTGWSHPWINRSDDLLMQCRNGQRDDFACELPPQRRDDAGDVLYV